MTTSEFATVLAWHDALDTKDIDTLLQLSTEDIDVGDAQGAAQGLTALREWAQGFPTSVTVGKTYVHGGVVVVEQTLGDGSTCASAFRVIHDKVVSVFRHDDLPGALAATQLTEDDLVS